MNYKELEKLALGSGFTHAVPLDTTTISLKQEVRDMCKNGCQQYARRWSCPPGCGSLNELREMICHYKKGILVQTVTELEDEFDWDGMIKAQNRHQEHFHLFLEKLCAFNPIRMRPAASRRKESPPWKPVAWLSRKSAGRIV